MLRNSKIATLSIVIPAALPLLKVFLLKVAPVKVDSVKMIRVKAVLFKVVPVKVVSIKVLAFVTTCLFNGISETVFADNEQTQDKIHNWQMKQIHQPSQRLLDREARGFVNIYDGFTDKEVNKIMGQKFERIDNMMFIRMKHTDSQGDVLTDPDSGLAIVDDDGC